MPAVPIASALPGLFLLDAAGSTVGTDFAEVLAQAVPQVPALPPAPVLAIVEPTDVPSSPQDPIEAEDAPTAEADTPAEDDPVLPTWLMPAVLPVVQLPTPVAIAMPSVLPTPPTPAENGTAHADRTVVEAGDLPKRRALPQPIVSTPKPGRSDHRRAGPDRPPPPDARSFPMPAKVEGAATPAVADFQSPPAPAPHPTGLRTQIPDIAPGVVTPLVPAPGQPVEPRPLPLPVARVADPMAGTPRAAASNAVSPATPLPAVRPRKVQPLPDAAPAVLTVEPALQAGTQTSPTPVTAPPPPDATASLVPAPRPEAAPPPDRTPPASDPAAPVTARVIDAGGSGFDLATDRLGAVRVALEGRDTRLGVQFTVETPATAALLGSQAPRLADAVATAGARLDALSVDVRGSGGNTPGRDAPAQPRRGRPPVPRQGPAAIRVDRFA